MKRTVINLVFLLMAPAIFSSIGSAQEKGTGTAGPVAFLASDTYTFEPVLEGALVTHDFIIENRGNAVLQILNVKAGCGCTTASNTPKEIAPGQSGKISLSFNSSGYGGDTVNKRTRVETNDPDHATITLTITGPIEEFAKIEPERAVLTGAAGEDIKTEIRITPNKKSPFKITGVKAKEGKSIRLDLKEAKTEDGAYILTVTNLRKEAAKYNDKIYLTTDNTAKPELSIYVAGEIK